MAGEPRVLILGGTGEARQLAQLLAAEGVVRPVTSMAGVTVHPRPVAGEVRIGGFGGAEGLAGYLAEERIAALVDATHPFAAQISAHAVKAAELARCPLVRLERPAWTPEAGDRWHLASDWPQALAMAGGLGRRVLAAVGARDARRLEGSMLNLVIRSIERPPQLPGNAVWIEGRPPFSLEEELALIQEREIDVILAKNSGGEAGRTKLLAARMLGLPVVLVARPALSPCPTVDAVEAVPSWIYARLGGLRT